MTQLPTRLICGLTLAATTMLMTACGGGGGSSSAGSPLSSANGANPGAVSSGTVTAFGSVFVNGHEFATGGAQLIDDDTGAAAAGTAGLDVGMVVDVQSASSSTAAHPVAAALHLHPLARGIVDASDTGAGTLTVMGQTVSLTAATLYSDHRACAAATPSTCTVVVGQSGLTATTGSGTAAVPGNYVTVHGYLYASGAPTAGANIVATLISVSDAPSTGGPAAYKVEGAISTLSGTSLTVGGLTVDLSAASCRAAGSVTPCASAFSLGQIVSALSASAPTLPATNFKASTAVLRAQLPVETTGQTVELQGKVSAVSSTTKTFVLRGISVDASGATGGTLPATGDEVRVLGTIAANGTSVTATSVTVLHAAISATYGFEGDDAGVAPGTAAGTYVLNLLGQSIAVDASARLCDRSIAGGAQAGASTTNPFNITTFQSYLGASTSKHLLVLTQADASGALTALSVTIVPTSSQAAVTGTVDASPAPVNSSASAVPTTFSVHALPVSADPRALVPLRRLGAAASGVSPGDLVLVRGTYAAPTLSVAVAASAPLPSLSEVVIDFGVPGSRDHDGF